MLFEGKGADLLSEGRSFLYGCHSHESLIASARSHADTFNFSGSNPNTRAIFGRNFFPERAPNKIAFRYCSLVPICLANCLCVRPTSIRRFLITLPIGVSSRLFLMVITPFADVFFRLFGKRHLTGFLEIFLQRLQMLFQPNQIGHLAVRTDQEPLDFGFQIFPLLANSFEELIVRLPVRFSKDIRRLDRKGVDSFHKLRNVRKSLLVQG
jgi:hypothetical protein